MRLLLYTFTPYLKRENMCTWGGGGRGAVSEIPVQIHLMTLSTGHGAHDSYLLDTGKKSFIIPI